MTLMRRERSQEARDLAAARAMLVVVDFLGRGHAEVRAFACPRRLSDWASAFRSFFSLDLDFVLGL
jgi:hypothetical protein